MTSQWCYDIVKRDVRNMSNRELLATYTKLRTIGLEYVGDAQYAVYLQAKNELDSRKVAV
tara:strand:+ start:875 stop:1054 length:180 start_codon:yes stop_codon:yes gene_type:complete